ncbi:tetratricopeptide repeat protein [Corallococcus sp. AS-1-6]|uniref:tetratricopeptide repeat protein n=2 Tax=Myxococcaceae TaxID=31 RepID=UPI001CBE2D31|nr:MULTISPECIES: tetratricopeptide repeat protein [unclassified Corallococcus]MBZ4331596.1 tetratricopeptide repeat protein [Corallococcus sp. AS-1-12]MBZ4371327.1 tetratricopeptide repeat protein [Corallococcus sp. AS-1-6]
MRESAEVISGPRKMSMPSEQPKTDVEKELSELRREVIESRNLVIKTDNLLKNLHAEVKAVGKRHEDFQKRQWISSAVAYALFAVLAVGGAVLVNGARSSSNTNERERLEKQVADLSSQLEKQRADTTAHLTAQRAANEVYKMMTTLPGDERLKGIDALVKLDTQKLSSLERQALNDRAAILRRETGDAALERGKIAFRKNEMPAVVENLSRFLAMNPQEADALDASFFLGTAYNQLRQHDKAVPLLARFVEGDRKSKTRDYAMLLLAQSYQETGAFDKAADTVRDALATYPATQYLSQFRGRLSSAKRAAAGGDAAAVPAAAPAAAPQAAPAVGTPGQ